MRLYNETDLEARLSFGSLEQAVHGALLSARATYRIQPDGRLRFDHEPWPIFAQPIETRYGTFPSDLTLGRNGCDLVVCGDACSDVPVTRLTVSAQVGASKRRLHVHGERRWRRNAAGGFSVEGPASFTATSLTWANAYGGVAELSDQAVPHPLNPGGKGFVLRAEDGDGVALPNVEHADAAATGPAHHVVPAGWGPVGDSVSWHMYEHAPRLARSDGPPDRADITRVLLAAGFGASPPRSVIAPPTPGAPVVVDLGATHLHTQLPALSLFARARVGLDAFDRPLSISGVWMFVPERLLVVTWQVRFRYPLRERERRHAFLLAA